MENNKSADAKSFGETKSEAALREEKVLEFWQENKIFEKSLEKNKGGKNFVFYEGPPTANGKPGIHHLEARAFKDAIPRYKTMQGFNVRRKGGWDTHGLPVELQVEKKLGLNSKKAIEEYGVEKFNEECKKSVWEYVDIWQKFTQRIGYWVDQENPYITYHNDYIESLWSVVQKVDEQDLLYKDYKVVPWCPRCGTTLSSHELAQGYQDVKDLSLYVKFELEKEQTITYEQVEDPTTVGILNTTKKQIFILAWTTTPWTLPGNVALAINPHIRYSIWQTNNNEILILAESERTDTLMQSLSLKKLGSTEGKVFTMKNENIKYKPLFPYLENNVTGSEKEKIKNAFKIYEADFVTTEDGTGVVHTAVMYGQDDFELGNKVDLPKFHLVNLEGKFIKGTDFLEGRFVKEVDEKGKPTLAVDIINYLTEKNLFFKKENYEHSYPHCWRCKTALIYYARDSWYIQMSNPKIKEKLIEENKSINWEPIHTREGRFGEWLKEIKDWAISRERYWGTPLPIWLSKDNEKIVVDSIETLKKFSKKSGNKYFVMRHGGTEGNAKGLVSYKNQTNDHLTKEGEKQVEDTANLLKDKKIDYIVTSHFTRTKETSEILRKVFGLEEDRVIVDPRLCEMDPGDFDGGLWDDYHNHVKGVGPNWFDRKISNGESLAEVKKRTAGVLYELEEKYQNKNIVLVTHGGPAWLLFVNAGLFEPDHKEYQPANSHIFIKEFKRFDNAEVRELPFVPVPHNENYELDLHKPYIDKVVLEKDGKEFYRTKEVMDVWFDSGAMPFAQDHYPFENKELVDGGGYPADFISEAIDQTRGWFYTLHAVGVLMGKGKAYKNVICLGHLLDAKGKKMSKSLGNIIDPWEMIEKYGVDTLRLWMYSVNQPGESKNFDEKTVLDLNRQVFGLFYNVLAFYEIYRDKELEIGEQLQKNNILDKWILARLNQLTTDMSIKMDEYKLLEPVRAIRAFMDDLSTWYLRRSRDRIKDEEVGVKQTLYFVLKTLSKLIAPFAPFAAEDVWLKLRNESDSESVHLVAWPKLELDLSNELELISEMSHIREVVSKALQLRQKVNIKVRQPLASLKINFKLAQPEKDFEEIIKDELNVKEIIQNAGVQELELDTNVTSELKQEGDYRELVRGIQDIRKTMGLVPSDMVSLSISTDKAGEDLIEKFKIEMFKTVGANSLIFEENEGTEIKVDSMLFRIKIEK